MKLVYLCHPVSGNVKQNLKRAEDWLLWIYNTCPEDVAVVSQWLLECRLFDDGDPYQRAKGLERDKCIVRTVDEVWLVGGRISKGMKIEADEARKHGIKVLDLTHLGETPPADGFYWIREHLGVAL